MHTTKKMRVAVVGYGVIGRLHAAILEKSGMLCAICDNNPAALREAPDVPCVADYTELLETVRPDAVHICTPHYLHADMVVQALRRNIFVLCEKPLCIHADEIDRILAAEKESAAGLGVCLQNRYNAVNRFVYDYLQGAKHVSGVGQVAWNRTAAYYASGDWRGKQATEGGGVLINQALHTLDLLQWFLGMPEQVIAQTDTLSLAGTIEVEDSALLLCRGKNEFTFFATNGAPSDFSVLIQLIVDGKQVTVLPDRVLIDRECVAFFEAPQRFVHKQCYGNGHEALIADFYDCIAAGRRFAIDGNAGAQVVRLILSAYQSHGKRISVPIGAAEGDLNGN